MQVSYRIHPNRLLRMGIGLGIILIVIGIYWRRLLGQANPLSDWYPDHALALEIFLGSALGLAGAAMATLLTGIFPAVRRMRDLLLRVIVVEEITIWHAFAFGLLAGIPEEIFFRGALQSTIGLLFTAVIFAGFHAISPLYFAYTLLAGLLLGALAAWRDNLWAATTAHIVYDAALFALFRWHARQNHTMIRD